MISATSKSRPRGPGRPCKLQAAYRFPMLTLSEEFGGCWRDRVEAHIRAIGARRIPGLVAVSVIGSDADRGRSWPALLAPILYALADLDLIDGVGMVGRIRCDWEPEGVQGWLQVEIRQLSAPVIRHRIRTAAAAGQQRAEATA